MKTRLTVILASLFLLTLPMAGFAMSHGEHDDHGKTEKMEKMDHDSHGGQKEHGSMDHDSHGDHKGHGDMEHGGMMMEGGMAMLGEEVEHGVKGMAHLKDVQEAMAKMGMKETHHFMIMLMDEQSGKALEEGAVAVKIKGPDGKEGKPVKLMGMQGHFGADITMAEKGTYHFKVGSKLADGKKRQYHFHYTVE